MISFILVSVRTSTKNGILVPSKNLTSLKYRRTIPNELVRLVYSSTQSWPMWGVPTCKCIRMLEIPRCSRCYDLRDSFLIAAGLIRSGMAENRQRSQRTYSAGCQHLCLAIKVTDQMANWVEQSLRGVSGTGRPASTAHSPVTMPVNLGAASFSLSS